MFASFFKPKWQHTKAEKRLKAVSKMQPSNEEKISILAQLAQNDRDERVRVAATEKLTDLTLLVKISNSDPSEITREQALHNISKILLNAQGADSEEKQQALNAVSNNSFLLHIALNSHDKTLREKAVEKLNDDSCLLTIAETSQRASVRTLAAEKINDPELLEKLNKFSRNKDNGVYKITRDKLQLLKEQEKLQQQRQEDIGTLLANIASHSQSDYFPLYAAKLSALENDWETLATYADGPQTEQYQNCLTLCRDTIACEEAKQAAAEQAALEKAQVLQQKQALLKELLTLKETSENYLPEPTLVSEFEAQLLQFSQRWEQLKGSASSEELNLFDKTSAQLGNLHHCFRIYIEQRDKIKELLANFQSAETEQLDAYNQQAHQLISKLSWPKCQAKPSSLLALEDALLDSDQQLKQQGEHTQKLRHELQALLEELETAIRQGEIKTADKRIKRAELLSKRMNGSLTTTLENRLKTLGSELQEIRDWQSFAVTPKKEALCAEMEALISSDMPVPERAEKIRRIQKEWKALDATDANHSQKLWKRFKQASDQAYAPCDQFFCEQKEVRIRNLELRKQLCQQLEQRCATPPAEELDWKALEDELSQFKLQWRTYSPVDRSPGKKLQAEFDTLLAQLEAPLKSFRELNAQQKKALVEQSKQLLESEITFQTLEDTKALQKQWKEIGQAPRNQERRLWTQFRENCNQIFESFYANKPQGDGSSLSLLSSLVAELETALEEATTLTSIQQRAQQAQQLLDDLEQSDAAATKPFAAALDKVFAFIQHQEQKLSEFTKAPYRSLIRKAQLCDQLEQSLLDDDQTTAEQAIADWQGEADNQTAFAAEINARFNTLLTLAEEPDELENIIHEQELRLRQLCIRLEIATSAPSPTEDQAMRMEYQMARLQQALDRQEKAFDLGEIKQLEYEWMCIPFANHFEELHDRFEHQIRQVL